MIVLLLFPVVIASVFEYTRINDNEELISTVYKKQLETIVSSVNSYAQDIADNWASRIELWLQYPSDKEKLEKLTSENNSINGIFALNENEEYRTLFAENNKEETISAINKTIRGHKSELEQLKYYYQQGYRKIISIPMSGENILLTFVAQDQNQNLTLVFIDLNSQLFLQNHIGSRIQAIAHENFRIDLVSRTTGELLLSSERDASGVKSFDQEGEMWFLPNVKIGINLKSQTISDLASTRIKEGIILMAIVLFVLLLGIWFLFVSVKREIQLAQIKSEFISNVSHEIRTPLSLISMYIETLEMGRIRTEEKIKEYYGVIRSETGRLTDMVNKILNFSRLESGRQKFDFSGCDLNTITHDVLETYEFHLRNKGFEVEFHPASAMPDINCDKDRIADALINLIDNAVKYSREQKRIEIKTGTIKNHAFVEVKDFGPGIPRKKQKQVFDKFYRVTAGDLANEIKGTGLGLSIVSEIVKAHKGKVSLSSPPGQGCTFRLFFPSFNKQ
jgi:two-component system phosphate regulon sensor histidine kinase PhoR